MNKVLCLTGEITVHLWKNRHIMHSGSRFENFFQAIYKTEKTETKNFRFPFHFKI